MKKSSRFLNWPLLVSLVCIVAVISACGKKDNPTYGEFMVVNASPGFGPVDVYVDNLLFNGPPLAYPLNTPYGTLEAGQHTVKVTNTGSTTSIFEGSLNTLGDINQSLFIYGLPNALNVFAVPDNTFSASADKALVRFFHLSPGGQTVDVGTLNGATFTPIYSSRAFETSTSAANNSVFNAMNAGDYEIDIRVAGTGISLYSDSIGLQGGKFYTLFLKGINGDPTTPLGLQIIKHN
jgi:hypothetical protein